MDAIVDYLPLIRQGFVTTVLVTVLGAVLSLVVAFALGLARLSTHRWLRWPAGPPKSSGSPQRRIGTRGITRSSNFSTIVAETSEEVRRKVADYEARLAASIGDATAAEIVAQYLAPGSKEGIAGTPDEIMVVCQDGRSQIKNREKALVVLASRLAERERAAREARERNERASQVGSGDRSEKIRTYNYPQNRVTDHRLEGEAKNHPLDSVIAGALNPVVAALARDERERQLMHLAASEEGAQQHGAA